MIKRNEVATCLLGVVLTFSGMTWLQAEESTGESKPAEATAKAAVDPSRRVPPFFGQVGLSTEQKEAIYKVRGKHQAKIEALQKEMARLQTEMLTECEAILNDSQKQLLNLRRDAASKARKARASTPVAVKPSTTPVN